MTTRFFPVVAFLCLVALLMTTAACSGGYQSDKGPSASAQKTIATEIAATEAGQYIGDRKTVCGNVESPTYARSSRGQPTFLNLDRPYPNQIFTVVIWGSNRQSFPEAPETLYRDKRICVTGLIESFAGVPQIEAATSRQIAIVG